LPSMLANIAEVSRALRRASASIVTCGCPIHSG